MDDYDITIKKRTLTKAPFARLGRASEGQGEDEKMAVLKVALCQMNPTVGDLKGNVEKMMDMVGEAEGNGARLIVFPELVITGYPPQDLLLYNGFNRKAEDAEWEFIQFLKNRETSAVVVWGNIRRGELALYNSAKVYTPFSSRVLSQDKCELPNYGVFDEKRYFRSGNEELSKVFVSTVFTFGVAVCEDIWLPENRRLGDFALNGAYVAIAINASPYYAGKAEKRLEMLKTRASDHMMFLLYVNVVGGQDDIVFDGSSMVLGPQGMLVGRSRMFTEEILYAELNLEDVERIRLADTRLISRKKPEVEEIPFGMYLGDSPQCGTRGYIASLPDTIAQVYDAAVLMVKDYFRKVGCTNAVIGESGGIDSALCGVIACDALGSGNVNFLLLPSKYSSEGSVVDAKKLAGNLKAKYEIIPIQTAVDGFLDLFKLSSFRDITGTLTEENLQARVRGTILMAYANRHPGTLVLTTGNKSEIFTGYFTLYGDSVGAFNPLRDLSKTMVYKLAKYRNLLSYARSGMGVIPREILDKAPSAELRKDQKDTDSLPTYDVLDPLLKLLVEERMLADEIIASGFCKTLGISPETVKRAAKMLHDSEFKRHQTSIGSKVTPLASGGDRRMPIVNKFEG